jgi:hypothetical protein
LISQQNSYYIKDFEYEAENFPPVFPSGLYNIKAFFSELGKIKAGFKVKADIKK